MTTPTDKDIPSNSVQDRLYNAEKFDEFMNSDNVNYTDRKGKSRWTLSGIRQAVQNWMDTLKTSSGASAIGYGTSTVADEIAKTVKQQITFSTGGTLNTPLEVQQSMADNKSAVFVPYEAFNAPGLSNRIFSVK